MVTEAVADARREIDIDPYAFQPGVGTRIAGLVDGEMGADPGYVFHTEYFEVGRGMASFTARFAGLTAKDGTLQLRVHMQLPGDPPRLALVNSERILLSRLAGNDGLISLKFEAFRDGRYAFYGTVIGNTDSRAEALSVTLELPEREAHHKDENTQARNSDFGKESARANPHLIATSPPTLRHPVSQVATAAQLKENVVTQWSSRLGGIGGDDPLRRWAALYTLQALSTYGVLTSGARGLCFGAAGAVIAPLVADKTAEITVAYDAGDPSGDTAASIEPAPHLSCRTLPFSALGSELVNFDFFWMFELDSRPERAAAWVARMQEAMSSLLPGGLAVITFGYDPQITMRRETHASEIPRIGRAELERLGMILISRGHQVAQMRLIGKYAPLTADRAGRESAAGIIVRRASLSL